MLKLMIGNKVGQYALYRVYVIPNMNCIEVDCVYRQAGIIRFIWDLWLYFLALINKPYYWIPLIQRSFNISISLRIKFFNIRGYSVDLFAS